MPVLTATDALAQTRAALSLVRGDPTAAALARRTSAEADLEGDLGRWLYATWWSGMTARPHLVEAASTAEAPLEAARRSVAATDPGWLVLAATDDTVVAAHLHTRQRTTVRADAVLGDSRPGRPPRPGDLVSLIEGASGLDPTRAWWWATGGAGPVEGPADRWYVHTPDLDAALRVVPLLLQLLAALQLPVSLKCPSEPGLFGRRDALVVYLPRAGAARAEAALFAGADRLVVGLDPAVPPLTRRLLPGIATAQDPGGSVSYGQLRCAQLAVVAADTDPDCPADELADRLARVGIDWARPEVLHP